MLFLITSRSCIEQVVSIVFASLLTFLINLSQPGPELVRGKKATFPVQGSASEHFLYRNW